MSSYGYIRVSTTSQAEAFGPEIQEQAIRAWCESSANNIGTIFTDAGVSGKLLDRPMLAEALRALGKGDLLVVARLDRLARDLITQELLLREIRRRGAELVSCAEGEQAYLADTPDDPSRTLIRQVLGAVAQYEREMVKLRLGLGRKAKRANGGYAGGEPKFGWYVLEGNGLVEDEREQEVLRVMRVLRSRDVTFEEIAIRLNGMVASAGPRRGKRWTKQAVHRILTRSSAA